MEEKLEIPVNQIKNIDKESKWQKIGLASIGEVWGWVCISLAVAALMLALVAISGTLLPGDAEVGANSQLLDTSPSWYDTDQVFLRNLLVLALHFFCCMVGAIIGRPHQELKGKWAKYSSLHKELPPWVENLCLAYAFTATLASIAIQSTGLGFTLSDISDATGLQAWEFVVIITPHAVIELVAVFLPLALFLVQARRRDFTNLNRKNFQALLIALPLILIASLIEIFVTPSLISSYLPVQSPEFTPLFDLYQNIR